MLIVLQPSFHSKYGLFPEMQIRGIFTLTLAAQSCLHTSCPKPLVPTPCSFQELTCAMSHTHVPLTIAWCLSTGANLATALWSSQSCCTKHCVAAQGRGKQPSWPCQAFPLTPQGHDATDALCTAPHHCMVFVLPTAR